MIMLYFFRWWYSKGYAWAAETSIKRLDEIQDDFSVGILLKTLLNPWKRITTYRNGPTPLSDVFKNMLDNLVSRFVGLNVRLAALLVGLVALIAYSAYIVVKLLLWPLLPLLPLILIITGLFFL